MGLDNRFRRLKILIRKHRIDALLWEMHFHGSTAAEFPGGKFPTCQDCEDFKMGLCSGGRDPLRCFSENKNAKWEVF